MMNESADVPSYVEVGLPRVSPNSGILYFTPSVSDSMKPAVGMKFDSIDHAFVFYEKYALASGFSVRRTTTYRPNGVCKLKYLVCSKEGFKSNKGNHISKLLSNVGSKRKRRSKPSKRVGCKAHLKLQLCDDGRYEVYVFVEEHNHSFVNQKDLQFLTAARKVDYLQENAIQALSSMNIGLVVSFNILKSLYGGYKEIGATKSDFKNYKRDINLFIGENDAEMFIQHLKKKKQYLPNFYFEYTLKEDGTLGGVFWADEDSKKNYSIFGDVVGFDATYRSNKYDMVFVPFTGIDNHNRNVLLGAALLGCETADSYRWLLRSYLDAFGVAPKVVVTDQDAAMRRAILDVLPNSRHRLCMWHIWEKVDAKVGPVLCITTDFKKKFGEIVWSDTMSCSEFETRWPSVLSHYGVSDNVWLAELFKIRKDWIPAFYHGENLAGLMRTTSRSESENHFFNQFCNSNSTLVEFLSHFDTAVECQRYEHRKNDHETRYTSPELATGFLFEKQALKFFTQTTFLDQQLEIVDAVKKCACMTKRVVGVDGIDFQIKDMSQPGLYYQVLFVRRNGDDTISCECRRFEQFGLLCRHIFFVLMLCDIRDFPKKYVVKRWTREVVSNGSSEPVGLDDLENKAEGVDDILREIRASHEYIINRLVRDKEQLCLYRDHVKTFMPKADLVQASVPPPSRRDRFAELLGVEEPSNVSIRVPVRSRTKGCGNQKRIKSSREIAMNEAGKSGRACSFCKGVGHNLRTCGPYLQTVKEKMQQEKIQQEKMQQTTTSPVVEPSSSGSVVDPVQI